MQPNRIVQVIQQKQRNLLNVYFTAGYPALNDTETIILSLEKAGVDLVEVGMPYSDPLADGPTIQQSGQQAIQNGMTLPLLFEQIQSLRRHSSIPLMLMGYYNQVMQYGEAAFIKRCTQVGIDGLILPDLPLDEYETGLKPLVEAANLAIAFLITPQTPLERIHRVDALSQGFIYMVSSASITGTQAGLSESQLAYFEKINALNLKTPRLIGFGIHNRETFATACQYAQGAIVGSAYIRTLEQAADIETATQDFISGLRL
ncbi:MAG TPA: tryptophan synthase subunit alpha [Saprospiraceae bacterium]|nr:tryptophan synthase subunit alpha [Saprospiraceae bacterium]HMQ85851.1 tryptophan synthase subunit alpha [Saprospiraceae bacterium]